MKSCVGARCVNLHEYGAPKNSLFCLILKWMRNLLKTATIRMSIITMYDVSTNCLVCLCTGVDSGKFSVTKN